MEMPKILNIKDFFVIGLMVLAFFIMLDVMGAGISTFMGARQGAATSIGA